MRVMLHMLFPSKTDGCCLSVAKSRRSCKVCLLESFSTVLLSYIRWLKIERCLD